jgi:hypothetical protein
MAQWTTTAYTTWFPTPSSFTTSAQARSQPQKPLQVYSESGVCCTVAAHHVTAAEEKQSRIRPNNQDTVVCLQLIGTHRTAEHGNAKGKHHLTQGDITSWLNQPSYKSDRSHAAEQRPAPASTHETTSHLCAPRCKVGPCVAAGAGYCCSWCVCWSRYIQFGTKVWADHGCFTGL